MVKLQRQVNNVQAQFFTRFLKPLSQQMGFFLCYEVDDVISFSDIPDYNSAKSAFDNKEFFSNVKNMLEACDLMTVTTENLKNHYVTKYGISPEKVIVIPNYLPRWWIGETYQGHEHQMELYHNNIKKPRIGFPSSSSHFDISGKNNYVDDFTHINDFIRSTVDKYTWVFIAGIPHQLEDLARDRKIEVLPGSDLLNYPRELWMKCLNAIVAPLQNNVFNNCKSNIKLLEGWSIGIPVIAQNISCYKPYTDMVFDDANGLQNQLDCLFRTKDKYKSVVKDNRHFVDYGRPNVAGFENGAWLEKNLDWSINNGKGQRGGHYSVYTLPQKTLNLDLVKFKEHVDAEALKNQGIKLEL